MGQLNSSRLGLARRRRGIKKAELAAALGVTPRMLNQYERGGTEASELVIEKMADALGFPRRVPHRPRHRRAGSRTFAR